MKIRKKIGYIIAGAALALIMQCHDIKASSGKKNPEPDIYSVELKSSGSQAEENTQEKGESQSQPDLQPQITVPTGNPAPQPTITAPAGPQITLPTESLPLIWSKAKNFERIPEGAVEVPFWQKPAAKTSIFGLNRWNHPESNGNFYSIAASDKVGPVTAEYRGNRLLVNFYNAKVSLKKSQTGYPKDEAISEVAVNTWDEAASSVVQMAFALKPATKDFVIRLDELGERVLVEMITNAVTQVSVSEKGEEEILTIESFKPVRLNLKRGADNSLEVEIPSAQSLLLNQEAFLNSKYISRLAVTNRHRGKTKITVWLREDVEFAPDGQTIRFFKKKTQNIKYSYGMLVLKKPEDFDLTKMDYILDVQKRKASLAFPYKGYIDRSYWIADNFITKIEATKERLEFTFPEVYELTVAEDRTSIYITAKKPKEIFTKVVFIDIGHGGNDPGAVRRVDLGSGYREYTEKEANLIVGHLLREKLKKRPDIKAYFSRLEDENPSAYTRAKLANEVGADFFMSLHNNMTTVTDRKIEGTDIYYLAGRKKSDLTSENLAQILLSNYADKTSFQNRLKKSAPHLYMVKYPQMPAVIVESGFMSDNDDLRKIFDPSEQEKTAEALYQSIVEAFQFVR